jgi:hypothetical protein
MAIPFERSRRCVAGALLMFGLASCGGGGSPMADPGTPRLDCLGAPLPTTAPATIGLSGVVSSNDVPIAGATVEGFRTGAGSPVATATSSASGSYALDVTTGGVPFDGALRVSMAPYLDTFVFPSQPLPNSSVKAAKLMTSAMLAQLGTLLGNTQAPANGWIEVQIVDCSGAPIAGATPSVTQNGLAVGQLTAVPSAVGTFYAFNVPPGQTVIGASFEGNLLHAHTVDVRANTITTTVVAPGPGSPPL